MTLKAPTYDRCASCSALNMLHRTNCYRCGVDLPLSGITNRTVGRISEQAEEYPQVDRRQVRRHIVCLPGTAMNEFGEIVDITIRNIGIGGLLFDSARQFNIEDKLTVRLKTSDGTFTTDVSVKHIGGLLSHETPYACGVELKEPGEELLEWIGELDAREPEPWSR